jgi:protoporphyrin/coproporphyrin ferrochelatase
VPLHHTSGPAEARHARWTYRRKRQTMTVLNFHLENRTSLAFTRTVAPRRIGVLLSNLGTPDGTDYWSVRRYLAEFLSDRRVIEAPRLLWFFILNALILTTRSQRKGKDYATIWNRDRDESPLKTISRSQAEKLQQSICNGLLGDARSDVIVDWGMRYGNPSLKAAVERLTAKGCHPLRPALSAVFGGDQRDRMRQDLRNIGVAAESTGFAGCRAILRR